MTDRIKVKTHGHQFYSEYEGKVLMYCQAVAPFGNGTERRVMPVPAVMLDTDHGPRLVLLQDYLRWTEIERIAPAPPTVAQSSEAHSVPGSPSSYRARPSDPDLSPVSVKDLSASASPATKEQQ